MTFIKKIDIPLNKTIMTLYDNNSFIIANQENGKLSIINNDTLEEKKQIETKIGNIEYIFYVKDVNYE
jgi:tricorn protease-like protein